MYKKAICILCTDNIEKPVIKKLCQYHYRLERAKVYSAKKKKQKSSSNEMDLFKEIWEDREPYCFITGAYLGKKEQLLSINKFHFLFHHVLRKGNYPRFKFYKRNIIMVTPEVHHNIETKAISDLIIQDKRYEKLVELYETLKQEYIS